ncbi:MAG: hypothetical protein AAB870_00720, partial [Patescibacteria group bacterium]
MLKKSLLLGGIMTFVAMSSFVLSMITDGGIVGNRSSSIIVLLTGCLIGLAGFFIVDVPERMLLIQTQRQKGLSLGNVAFQILWVLAFIIIYGVLG